MLSTLLLGTRKVRSVLKEYNVRGPAVACELGRSHLFIRDERELFTVVVPGGTCALRTLCGSAVGGSGRRAVILLARMIRIIDASCRSVHERAPLFPRINRTCKREGRTCLRHQNGRTFHLKLWGCSRVELGQECRAPKRCRCVMLRFVWLLRISLCTFGSEPNGRASATSHKSCTHWMWLCRKIPTVSIDTLLQLASRPGLNLRTRSFLR